MSLINQYDKKQYENILYLIDNYIQKVISINKFLNDFEAIIYSFERINEKDRNILLNLWGCIEDTYALMLDNEETCLSNDDSKYIKKILIKTEDYIKKLLSNEKIKGEK